MAQNEQAPKAAQNEQPPKADEKMVDVLVAAGHTILVSDAAAIKKIKRVIIGGDGQRIEEEIVVRSPKKAFGPGKLVKVSEKDAEELVALGHATIAG